MSVNLQAPAKPRIREPLKAIYEKNEYFFPLIAAVLDDSQNGKIFVDDRYSPREAYVEHSFGFAQIFGESVHNFEQKLKTYFFTDKNLTPQKIRLYTPILPGFFQNDNYASLRSERQRFFLNYNDFGQKCAQTPHTGGTCAQIAAGNLPEIERAFNLAARFWPDFDSFVNNSLAQIVYCGENPASICYAAALANGKAEIDILTLPEYRGRGYGLQAAMAFIKKCLQNGMEPLWDCFTNNQGSMALAKRLGFAASLPPYKFFTIPH